MNYTYLLVDDGGVSNWEDVPVLMAIGSVFRHEYGIYKVLNYRDENGEIETRFSKITQVECDRIAKK